MSEIGADGVSLALLERLPEEETQIRIRFPGAAFRSGALVRECANPALYKAWIRGGSADAAQAAAAALKTWGFAKLELSREPDAGPPQLAYGGAEPGLLERIQGAVEAATGVRLPTRRIWPIDCRDIWVMLPPKPDIPEVRQTLTRRRASGTQGRIGRRPGARTFIKITDGVVDLAGLELPRRQGPRQPGVPALELLHPYCLDAVTAETLVHLAQAFLLGEPGMLEGPTSSSKSSAILYLCALMNLPVARLNLNGASDAGELVGRYVPARDGGWRFNEGLLVGAMREGHVVVLDEINLAEPAAVERLNPVLEAHPSLVLSEHDHSVVAPVHPDFRVFGTCNPFGDYVGRHQMSPALKDRFQSFRVVPAAGEAEYLALGRLIVHGEQPAIALQGATYCGFEEPASLPNLARLRDIDDFLEAFARFQASVDAAAGGAGEAPKLGAARREPYVFTRRGFLSTLRFMDRLLAGRTGKKLAATAAWAALERYFMAKIATEEDRAVVVELAHAVGLGAKKWRTAS